jgi:hypothetical protein
MPLLVVAFGYISKRNFIWSSNKMGIKEQNVFKKSVAELPRGTKSLRYSSHLALLVMLFTTYVLIWLLDYQISRKYFRETIVEEQFSYSLSSNIGACTPQYSHKFVGIHHTWQYLRREKDAFNVE